MLEHASKAVSPHAYLAHASEDHDTLARPLAAAFMASGVETWFDEWEIRSGDSLRRKMEQGLADCTHFVVLLTPRSVGKPWVETEIDAGFVKAVEGKARFIGLRVGLNLADLSPFLRTVRCPEIQLDDPDAVAALVAEIHGVSRKPARGPAPAYVRKRPEGVPGWSLSASALAEHLVVKSRNGTALDPQVRMAEVAREIGLPEQEVRLGLLDLEEAGLVERSASIGSDAFWPKIGLFAEFDSYFMPFNNERAAVAVANWAVSSGKPQIKMEDLAKEFLDVTSRQLNSALSWLLWRDLVQPMNVIGGKQWITSGFFVTDRTRRFVRDHG